MSVLKYFKNTPGRPHRTTGLKCNFFSSNSQWGLWRKKGPVAPHRATGACRPPLGQQGPVYSLAAIPFVIWACHMPPFPLSSEPKNSGQKRGVRRRKTAKLCRIAYFLKWWKSTVIGSRMFGQRMRHLGNPWSPCWAVATCDLVLAARYTMIPILSYSSV